MEKNYEFERATVVKVRVSNDEHHSIYIEDFDALDELICFVGLQNLNKDNYFIIRFVEVEDGRDLRTDDDESECC